MIWRNYVTVTLCISSANRLCLSVCMSVCLLATLRKNFRTDLHEIFRESWQRVSEQMFKFWWRSGSRIRTDPNPYRDTCKTCLGGGMQCTVPVLVVKAYASLTATLMINVRNFLTMHQLLKNALGVSQQSLCQPSGFFQFVKFFY